MGLRDRQTIGDGIESGLDKMGGQFRLLGVVVLDQVDQWLAKYDVKLSLDLEKPYGVRIGLEPKE